MKNFVLSLRIDLFILLPCCRENRTEKGEDIDYFEYKIKKLLEVSGR